MAQWDFNMIHQTTQDILMCPVLSCVIDISMTCTCTGVTESRESAGRIFMQNFIPRMSVWVQITEENKLRVYKMKFHTTAAPYVVNMRSSIIGLMSSVESCRMKSSYYIELTRQGQTRRLLGRT